MYIKKESYVINTLLNNIIKNMIIILLVSFFFLHFASFISHPITLAILSLIYFKSLASITVTRRQFSMPKSENALMESEGAVWFVNRKSKLRMDFYNQTKSGFF